VSSGRAVVLLLDSLDQLTAAHRAHSLTWLPRPLPANVHMVVSTLPYEHDLLDMLHVIVSSESQFVQVISVVLLLWHFAFSAFTCWLGGRKGIQPVKN